MQRFTKRIRMGLGVVGVILVSGAAMSQSTPEEAKTRDLYETAREEYNRMESYIARLRRHEVVKGKSRPEELLLLKFRERPWSVYMKWLGESGRGREGVYVKGQHGDKIHTRLAAGDIPFVPAGRRMALSPDSPLMRSASPHPITDLGIGASLEKIGGVLAAPSGGDRWQGSLNLVGPEQRPEFLKPAYGIEHRIPAGLDPMLPEGGRRTYYFDPVTQLPTVLRTLDNGGREVEYYHYDRLQPSVHLDDQDFDPDLLWGPPARASS